MICRFSQEAQRRDFTPLENLFITDYLPAAEQLPIQVYLYGLMQCRCPGTECPSFADTFGVSEEAVVEAFAYWQDLGLVRITSDKPLAVEYLPLHAEGSASPLNARYASLVRRINLLTAPRQFGLQDLRHVYDWIEVYGLEEGTVLELISHCMDLKGRRVSINYMSSVARSWADEHVLSPEDARAYLADFRLRHHGASDILRFWNKRRKPTEAEVALYDKWTKEWGFTPEGILAALPRLTVSGSPNFTYLDELLDGMRERSLTDRPAIAEDDSAAASDRSFARLLFERAGKTEAVTSTYAAQVSMFLHEMKVSPELMLYAAECSRGANEPFGRLKKLLSEWHGEGIATVQEAEAYQQRVRENRSAGKGGKTPKKDYSRSAISDDDLEKMLLEYDDDTL